MVGSLVEELIRHLVLGCWDDGIGAECLCPQGVEREGDGDGISSHVSVLLACGAECGTVGGARARCQ